ncbi:hypothetical protein NQ318_023485 [Aromia moschata]|uniref:Uncharacterized protein n=1 Tax=Aromia moschata TaxID=1265417 RepID=A0AAV8YPS3_9CUCU|nr:hypothetical protein NQ318_023485 [Aromia moschata]
MGLEIGEITTVQTYMRLSLSRNYFESYAHARELNIQSHTANRPTKLVTLAHNRSSSHLLSHLPRDTSTYGKQQYRNNENSGIENNAVNSTVEKTVPKKIVII